MHELLLLVPNETVLKCPKCNEEAAYSKIYSVTNTLGAPEYTDKNKYRQGSVTIETVCEFCQAKTEYIFGQHKGQIFLEVK